MSLFPAILIGGPPHSGKSVLAYSLSQTLRRANVDHYLLRAYPDGEGDWSNEAHPTLVRTLRRKGTGNAHWVAAICNNIDHRRLPLLVDAGGRPTSAQEAIFSHCTHSIILASTEAALREWRAIAARHHLKPLAELHSVLHGKQTIHATTPILRGTISGLERGTLTATGKIFDALIARLHPLMAFSSTDIRAIHIAAAPAETAIDIERLCHTLTGGTRWQPHHLPTLRNYLPEKTPLATYGRAPSWVVAALACHTLPADFFQFDPRIGWLTPPPLTFGIPPNTSPLRTTCTARPGRLHLRFFIQSDYLPLPSQPLVVPPVPQNTGIILDGKMPQWLITALARRYTPAPWLAIFQPQLNGAVVIHTANNTPTVGEVITLEE